MKEIGLKIRNERKSIGWSLKQMAEKIGISPMTLHRIETGKRSPSVGVLAEIAHHLIRPIDFFIKEKVLNFSIYKRTDRRLLNLRR